MRWSRLFDDLEAQLIRLEQAELEADVVERTRWERGQVSLAQALAADCGRAVSVQVIGVGALSGQLREVGRDWCVIDTPVQGPARRRSVLFPLTALQTVTGLSGFADQQDGLPGRRFGLRSALRALGRDRGTVRVYLSGGGSAQGTVDRVGLDHFDLADHPDDAPRRSSEVRAVHAVPLWAFCGLRQL